MTSPYTGQWTHRLTSTGASCPTTFFYEWQSPNCPPYADEMATRISLLQRECDYWMYVAWFLHFGLLDVMPLFTKDAMKRFRANFGKPSIKRAGRGRAAREHRILMCLLMAVQCEEDATGTKISQE